MKNNFFFVIRVCTICFKHIRRKEIRWSSCFRWRE